MEKIERAPYRRVIVMVVLAGVLAAVASAVGWPMAGWGILAALPVALFNYLFGQRTLDRMPPERRAAMNVILLRSLVRMVLSVTALLLAIMGGPAFVVGAFVGLLIEMFTYVGEYAWSMATGKG